MDPSFGLLVTSFIWWGLLAIGLTAFRVVQGAAVACWIATADPALLKPLIVSTAIRGGRVGQQAMHPLSHRIQIVLGAER